jgi:hypothetical protein
MALSTIVNQDKWLALSRHNGAVHKYQPTSEASRLHGSVHNYQPTSVASRLYGASTRIYQHTVSGQLAQWVYPKLPTKISGY